MTLRASLRPLVVAALPSSGLALLVAACGPAPTPTAAAAPSVTARPGAVSTAIMRTPRPPATLSTKNVVIRITPGPLRAHQPSPMSVPTPSYVFAKPHDPPKILAVNLSTNTITPGQTVSGSVETTSNVASVEARIAGWSMSVPRTRVGHFEAEGQIPDLPFFTKGTYTLEVIARNADGLRAERDIPITLR